MPLSNATACDCTLATCYSPPAAFRHPVEGGPRGVARTAGRRIRAAAVLLRGSRHPPGHHLTCRTVVAFLCALCISVRPPRAPHARHHSTGTAMRGPVRGAWPTVVSAAARAKAMEARCTVSWGAHLGSAAAVSPSSAPSVVSSINAADKDRSDDGSARPAACWKTAVVCLQGSLRLRLLNYSPWR